MQTYQAVVLFGEFECDSVDCEFDRAVTTALVHTRQRLVAAGWLSSVINTAWRGTYLELELAGKSFLKCRFFKL